MRARRITSFVTLAAVLMLLSLVAVPTGAAQQQSSARPDIPIPRLPDGKPNLSWDDPRYKGTWHSGNHQDVAKDVVDPKDGIPFQPWAKALYDYRNRTDQKDDPNNYCLPGGGTRPTSLMSGWEFIHMPEQKRIIRILERPTRFWQVIYMDGRGHPEEAFALPTWMGHAIGRWDGDTLVVETTALNEGHWISRTGSPRTNMHKVTERFTRKDYHTMAYEATIDDPGAYTRPWKLAWDIKWEMGEELEEVVCMENNKFPENYHEIEPDTNPNRESLIRNF
jgi:hypothetical protein